MIKSFLVLSGLVVSQAASASSFLNVARCTLLHKMMDYGMSVDVVSFMGPPVFGQPRTPSLTATIREMTLMGERQIGSFRVARKPVPAHAMGAPVEFVGKDFDLELVVDGTPVQGGIYSRLTADVGGRRISEEMVCTLTR